MRRTNRDSLRLGDQDTLDGLHNHVLLVLHRVPLSEHLDLHTLRDRSTEHSSKGSELVCVGRRVELDDLDHEGSLGVAGEHGSGKGRVEGSRVGSFDLAHTDQYLYEEGGTCETHLVLGSFDGVGNVVDDHVDKARRRSKELRENEAKERSDVHLEHGRLKVDPERSESRLERFRVLSQYLLSRLLDSCEQRGETCRT